MSGTLTEKEAASALASYAKEHGRYWKRELRHSWETCIWSMADDSGTLQRIRNQFGPTWLVRFRLSMTDLERDYRYQMRAELAESVKKTSDALIYARRADLPAWIVQELESAFERLQRIQQWSQEAR